MQRRCANRRRAGQLNHSALERYWTLVEGYRDHPDYQDDPERGIYWGPPDEVTGRPQPRSRAWDDWRAEVR